MTKTPEKPSTVTDAAKPAPDTTVPDPTASATETPKAPKEIGGRGGADPTRFGDWEKNGRCVDF